MSRIIHQSINPSNDTIVNLVEIATSASFMQQRMISILLTNVRNNNNNNSDNNDPIHNPIDHNFIDNEEENNEQSLCEENE